MGDFTLSEENSLLGKLRKVLYSKMLLLVVTVLLLIGSLYPVFSSQLDSEIYEEGDIARRTLRAPRELLLEDAENTEERRLRAEEKISKVFVMTEFSLGGLKDVVNELFTNIKEISSVPASNGEQKLELNQDQRVNFERKFGIDFFGSEWDVILDSSNWEDLVQDSAKLVFPILKRGVIASKIPLEHAIRTSSATLIKEEARGDKILSEDAFYDLAESQDLLRTSIPSGGFKRGADYDSVVFKVSQYLLKPNVVFDNDKTESRIHEARNAIKPIYFKVHRGEVIVRGGDVLSAEQAKKLNSIRVATGDINVWWSIIGNAILATLAISVLYFFSLSYWTGFKPQNRDIIVLSLTLVGSFVILEAFLLVGEALSYSYSTIIPEIFMLSAPIAAGGILLQVTQGGPSVFLFAATFGLLAGIFLEGSWLLVTLIFIGNLIASLSIKRATKRSLYLLAGGRITLVSILIVLSFFLIYPDQGLSELASRLLWVIFGGLLSGVFAAAFTPVAEFIGGYVTDIKLLELASLDHPLLKELSLQAPGTWNHSMVIGQMGEAAAEAIGANPLLTRVGAYYHDIGKTKKPAYFVENQHVKDNRHDKLAPSMSALIVKAHVKDGIELARQYHLPKTIEDFIPQHHGTALIEYFYDKALKEAEEGEEVDRNLYCYGGPKPQTKEAGILMLADVVEASSRTLTDPTPARLQGLVQKMINKIFVSGELEESNLTLKDLHLIAKSFTRVLSAIHHKRIEYSEPAEKGREHKEEDQKGEKEDAKTIEAKASEEKAAQSGESGHRHPGSAEHEKETADGAGKKGAKKSSPDAIKRLGI